MVPIAFYPIIFGASMNLLCNIKVESVVMLNKCSYRSSHDVDY